MAFEGDNQGYQQRPMYEGNWQCSGCGAEIKKLPFEPDGQRPIYCPDCYKKRREERGGYNRD